LWEAPDIPWRKDLHDGEGAYIDPILGRSFSCLASSESTPASIRLGYTYLHTGAVQEGIELLGRSELLSLFKKPRHQQKRDGYENPKHHFVDFLM
jgi:hypothetical protein